MHKTIIILLQTVVLAAFFIVRMRSKWIPQIVQIYTTSDNKRISYCMRLCIIKPNLRYFLSAFSSSMTLSATMCIDGINGINTMHLLLFRIYKTSSLLLNIIYFNFHTFIHFNDIPPASCCLLAMYRKWACSWSCLIPKSALCCCSRC